MAQEAGPAITGKQIKRAEAFTLESFVHSGEQTEVALAPGSPRYCALQSALKELDQGAQLPSIKWRHDWSFLLGLERVLSQQEPHLADGTTLNPHQVDALSGTLTALLAARIEIAEIEITEPIFDTNGSLAQEINTDDQQVAAELAALDQEHASDQDSPDDQQIDQAEVNEISAGTDQEVSPDAFDDPNAGKRFWFEHATGSGKTVAAMGFVEAQRTGGILILTHRRNLVDQFNDELRTRGYADRICGPLLDDQGADLLGPVTVETYQWFVRNAGKISNAYTIVICDEAHTALGEKTSSAIRQWTGPIFIGMTATGALIARHVTDLFPTQTSRFDLAQAARQGVISPLRCLRIPPGPGVRTIAKVPLRKGAVDLEFDQEMLAELLDHTPFNMAIADLYKAHFSGLPGVIYTAGVQHAKHVAQAFRSLGIKAEAVSGETPKRQLAETLASYEAGQIDVLVNAQLLAEGWNSPRATVCMHLAPTASKRIYQQRVGRVTRRHSGKEAGVVVDFVHPATSHDDPVVTLHSLLDRDLYRGGAVVIGPIPRGRGRQVKVERRVLPIAAEQDRRQQVFERQLWRIGVENLNHSDQQAWAALAGIRVTPSGWQRARAMLQFDISNQLKCHFLLTVMKNNHHPQLQIRALQELAVLKDPDGFDQAVKMIEDWPKDQRQQAAKVCLQALAEKRIGDRGQAISWIWQLAFYTSQVHEQYAFQRWPKTKRLLGMLVNSSNGAHARNARQLVQSISGQDRRLQIAVLACARAHTPQAEQVLSSARQRLARKPNACARQLLNNFPKTKSRPRKRRRRPRHKDPSSNPKPLSANGTGSSNKLQSTRSEAYN